MNIWAWLDRKLSRVTSAGDYIPEIDGLRFVAILPVVILHLTYWVLKARLHAPPDLERMKQGDGLLTLVSSFGLGVQLFFVISGFVLARPMASYWLGFTSFAPSLSRYYLRRITRIEPPYLLALTACFLMFPWAHWRSYVAGLIYMHEFIFHRMNDVNTPFWSLEVEVLFYLTAPLLALVFRIRPASLRRAILVAAIAVLSFSAQHWLTAKHSYLEYTYPGCLHFFLAGMLLADLYVSGVILRRRSYVWDLVAVSCAASIPAVTVPPCWRFHWLVPLLILMGCWGVFQGRIVNACACLRPVTIVGTMCYTIYLWHIVFIFWISSTLLPYLTSARLSNDEAMLLAYLVGVPPILLASAVMFYFTEKPFMNGPGSRYLERVLRGIGSGRAAMEQVITLYRYQAGSVPVPPRR